MEIHGLGFRDLAEGLHCATLVRRQAQILNFILNTSPLMKEIIGEHPYMARDLQRRDKFGIEKLGLSSSLTLGCVEVQG